MATRWPATWPKSRGDDFTFLVLAGIAAAGLVFFWLLMPETRQAAPAA